MNSSDYRICLDIQSPHGAVVLDMKQGDTDRCICINLTDGGRPYRLTEDCQALFTAKKPDGTVIYNLCTQEDNAVIYAVTPQTTACVGTVQCELRLYSGQLTLDSAGKPVAQQCQQITSAAFTIIVHQQVCQDADVVASAVEATALQNLLTNTAEAIASCDMAADAANQAGADARTGAHAANTAAASAMSVAETVQQKLDAGEFVGPRGEKGDPCDVTIDDGSVAAGSTWSSEKITQFAANPDRDVDLGEHTLTAYGLILRTGDDMAEMYVTGTRKDQNGESTVSVFCYGDGTERGILLGNLAPGSESTDAVNKGQLDASEAALIERLCPAFTQSGDTVACTPVAGYPLHVVSTLEASGAGYAGVTLHRNGKNLFDISKVVTSSLVKNNGDGSLTVKEGTSGGVKGARPRTLRDYAPGLKVGKTYVLTAQTTGSKGYVYLNVFGDSWHFGKSLVITEAALDSDVLWYVDYNTTGTVSNIQIEEGKTATAYEPYRGDSFFVDFGQTVSGGSYDWSTGILTDSDGNAYPFAPREVLPVTGANYLSCDAGSVTVTGRADPVAEMEKLKNAILALGGNI